MNAGKLIYWFDELGQGDNELVGRKCANLGELTRAGFQVPPGFALSLEAYKRFLTDTGAIEEIRRYFAAFDADPDNPKELPKFQEASRIVRGFVGLKAMPENMEHTVARYYDELCQKTGIKDVPVATRSAGTASHPGQYETYLYVRGKPDVMKNIIKVWSSTFNPRSLIARARKRLPLDYDPIGVAVLKMVNAKAAGIMFTAEPTTGESSKIVIEGSWGLGESAVSGAVNPDSWVVDKDKFEIIERRLSVKLVEHVFDPVTCKVSKVDIAADKQGIPCLTDEELVEIARAGRSIEQHCRLPQDIEWAIDSDLPANNIVILQTRPEKFNIELRLTGF